MKDLFPYTLTVLDIIAAIVYACHKDYWRAGYWLAAAFLTFCTTRM